MGERERGMGNEEGERERGTGTGYRKRETGNGERGTGNGKWENEKWKQHREGVIKPLKVHEFNSGFVPIFQLPVPYAHSPVPVSGFRNIRLKRSEQLRH